MFCNPALSEILLSHLRSIDSHFWPGIDGLTTEVVLDAYPRAVIAGQVPGKDELLQQHPELAAEVEELFVKPEWSPNRVSPSVVAAPYLERTD